LPSGFVAYDYVYSKLTNYPCIELLGVRRRLTCTHSDKKRLPVRFFTETTTDGGSKHYLMVKSNGELTALDANDLVLDSQNDIQCRFRFVNE